MTRVRSASRARFVARPRQQTQTPTPGLRALSISKGRDALLYVPELLRESDGPAPLVVTLHGAGGNETYGIELLRSQADALGVVLLSPASRGSTWDVILDNFGPDVEFINTAMERTFDAYNIDPARLAIGGFSDGASYALSVGLANGDLFTHILAFSPGFSAHPLTTGKPHVFVSHGKRDRVLPIEVCSRRLVPTLRAWGHVVDYHEFDGPHRVPAELATLAVEQLTQRTPIAR